MYLSWTAMRRAGHWPASELACVGAGLQAARRMSRLIAQERQRVAVRKKPSSRVCLTEVSEAKQQPAADAANLLIATRMVVAANEGGTEADVRRDTDRALDRIARINAD